MNKPKQHLTKPAAPASKPPSKEEILSRLFKETEAPVQRLASDRHLDSLNEVRKALGISVINIEDKYIAKERMEYKVRFRRAYYIQLYKFIGVPVTDENIIELMKNKPFKFARWTLEIIYNRFPRGTVHLLRKRNIKLNGAYLFKHHQGLTQVGVIELEEYIAEAIVLMQQSNYWDQFLRKLAKLNNRPFQLDMFDKE